MSREPPLLAPALRGLADNGIIGPLDLHFAEALRRLVPHASDAALLGAALASRYTREGHVCADLGRLTARPLVAPDGTIVEGVLPDIDPWCDALHSSPLVSDGESPAPLVLDAHQRLYLRRYWQHETRLAELLRGRVGLIEPPVEGSAQFAPLRSALDRLFGPAKPLAPPDWQRIAAQIALLTRFTVISGGPGTGKTSTVVKLVAVLIEEALTEGRPVPRVALLAPTGKAAARLVESIRGAKGRLECDAVVRGAIVEEASTIHRALGVVPGSRTQVRHHADNPLRADVVIVDEASMVDVALMRRLAEAVPRRARLILLGDRDQLASVEAGAVLGDICGGASAAYSSELRHRVHAVFGEELPDPQRVGPAGMGDHVVQLLHSHRFGANSGIGNLARTVQRGNADAAIALLHAPSAPDVTLVPRAADSGLGGALRRAVVTGFKPSLRARSVADALQLLESFRVLVAHRHGSSGVESLNELIEEALLMAGLLPGGPQGGRRWYSGRPVLIVQNDYHLRLFNGDIGVIWRPRNQFAERAYFADSGGSVRELAPARLPPHETVYAMSIHKSQGSELDAVAVVLPDARSPLLTRELLYTAITRARRRVVLYGGESALRAAVARRIQRSSGLRDLLWGSREGVVAGAAGAG